MIIVEEMNGNDIKEFITLAGPCDHIMIQDGKLLYRVKGDLNLKHVKIDKRRFEIRKVI